MFQIFDCVTVIFLLQLTAESTTATPTLTKPLENTPLLYLLDLSPLQNFEFIFVTDYCHPTNPTQILNTLKSLATIKRSFSYSGIDSFINVNPNESHAHGKCNKCFLISENDKELDVLLMVDLANETNTQRVIEMIQCAFADPNLEKQPYIILTWPNTIDWDKNGSQGYELKIISILQTISNGNFTMMANFYVLFSITDQVGYNRTTTFELWEVYYIKNTMMSGRIASFGPGDKISMESIRLPEKQWRRRDFQGVNIVAIAIGEEYGYPFEVTFTTKNGFDELHSGFGVSLYRDLKYMLNFSEKSSIRIKTFMSESSDAQTRMESNEADICITQNVYRPGLLAWNVTILHPTLPLVVTAFCRDPNFKVQSNIYTASFTVKVWAGLLATFTLMIFTLSIIARAHRIFVRDYFKVQVIQDEAVIWGTGILCQQNWHLAPSAMSLKTVFQVASMCGLILYTAFLSTLVSKLSVHLRVLDSFQDVLAHNYTLYYYMESASMSGYMNGLTKFHNIPPAQGTNNTTELTSAVMNSKVALLYYWDSVPILFESYYVGKWRGSGHFLCNNILAFPVDNLHIQSGAILKANSPFEEHFNQVIVRLKESGLNHRYVKHYNENTKPRCFHRNPFRYLSLGISEIGVTFVILVVGILMAIFVLIVELTTNVARINISLYNNALE